MTQEAQYTWFELFMLMTRFDEISTLSLGVFISIVSGFLVMSYAIGAKLKRRQVWMVVPAYVAFVTLPFLNAFAYSSLADYHRPNKFFVPDRPEFSVVNVVEPFAASNIGFVVGTLIILGSLVFFFDVRRSAAQDAEKAQEEVAPMEESAPAINQDEEQLSEPDPPEAETPEEDPPEVEEPKP